MYASEDFRSRSRHRHRHRHRHRQHHDIDMYLPPDAKVAETGRISRRPRSVRRPFIISEAVASCFSSSFASWMWQDYEKIRGLGYPIVTASGEGFDECYWRIEPSSEDLVTNVYFCIADVNTGLCIMQVVWSSRSSWIIVMIVVLFVLMLTGGDISEVLLTLVVSYLE